MSLKSLHMSLSDGEIDLNKVKSYKRVDVSHKEVNVHLSIKHNRNVQYIYASNILLLNKIYFNLILIWLDSIWF